MPALAALEAEAEATTLRLLRQLSVAQSRARDVHQGWATGLRQWMRENGQAEGAHALLQSLGHAVDVLDEKYGAMSPSLVTVQFLDISTGLSWIRTTIHLMPHSVLALPHL